MAEDNYYKDLQLTRRFFDRETSDRQYVDLQASVRKDLQTVDGRDNLAQAIINRLLTRKGELKSLGHPNYGSRLYLLVGELNNIRIRGKAELYIRECLAQEKRIEEVTQINFAPPVRDLDRNVLKTEIFIKPKNTEEEIVVEVPIVLG